MSQINQAVEKREVEYVAFNSDEKIRLTMGMVRQYIAEPAIDKQTKEVIQPDDRECMAFLMLCRARRLNPWEKDCWMLPYWDGRTGRFKWNLITAHNAFLKRAEANPQYDGMESGVLVEIDGEVRELQGDFVPDTLDGEKVKLVGGWARVVRKDRKIPTYRRSKLSTYQQNFGRWVSDAAGMIVKVAEADSLRSAFPNTIGGMYLREEQPTEIQATIESAERRPDFGQIMDANRPASAQRKPKAIAETAKTPQDASGQQPATPSQPPQEAAVPPAEPPAQAPVEPPATVPQTARPEQDPEGLNHSGRQGDMPPEEDLSIPPETEPPQEAAQGEAPAAFVPDARDTAPVQNVKRLCHESGLTVEQLMTWARAKKIAKEGQKLGDLAEQKLLNIGTQWQTILPIIRQTAAK